MADGESTARSRLARVAEDYPEWLCQQAGEREFTATPPEGEGEPVTASSPELLRAKLHAAAFEAVSARFRFVPGQRAAT
jgi:hypothetical protein